MLYSCNTFHLNQEKQVDLFRPVNPRLDLSLNSQILLRSVWIVELELEYVIIIQIPIM